MLDLRFIARALGGKICGNEVLCPGPGHSAIDRSLSVTIGFNGKLVVHSFAEDDWQQCRDYVKNRLGLREEEIAAVRPISARKPVDPAQPGNGTRGLCIWHESANLIGTLAETYLRGRMLKPPADCSRFIRFHAKCPFAEEHFPALLSLIRNIETDKAQAVQRTALNPDGTAIKRNGKTLRMTLGPMTAGAVKIDDDADVTQGLAIGEGLESCLAAHQLGLRPVWAVLGTSGISSFPVLAGIDSLTILAETGDGSKKAIEECGLRWYEAGRKVIINRPKVGSDLNDAIMRLGS